MSNVSNRWAVALIVLLFPIAAFADLNGTVTLSSGQSLNLETGAAVSSAGDLLWSGSTLTPQGAALALNVTAFASTFSGPTAFASITLQELQAFGSAGSHAAISGITVGTIIGAKDNSGNYAKLLVTSVSSSISFQFTTYGATGGAPGAPTITMIQNNYSYIVPGLPNYGIAPGTLFIIKGANLASATTVSSLQSSAAPGIPKSLNGASISVTVGSTTVQPAMYYAIATQIAAVLPSGTPTGTGTLTVTYNNVASAPATITVVASALGLDTYYGAGTGLGVATDLSYNVFNYNSSASPGQSIILWGSGLGADTADSDTTVTTTPHAVNVPLTVYIGGIAVTPAYAGSSGYPGLNQINVTIPSSVAPGCAVSIVGVSGSIVSNIVTLPIAAGGGVCTDPATGQTGTQILSLGSKANYNSGALLISQGIITGQPEISSAIGVFDHYQGTQSASGYNLVSIGSCIVNSSTVGATSTYTTTGLDAGTITVTGPAGSQTLSPIPSLAGFYEAQLPSGFIPTTGGSYTFNGTGGKDVGSFSVSVSYTNPLVWTNSGSITAVTRANGQNVTWSGGAPGSFVYLGGTSSSATATASFTCYAPVSAQSFTIPSYILLALPAGSGTLGITNETTPVSFPASGLDYGYAAGIVTFSISPTYN